MVLTFKNNNIYYKDFKLNNGMFSWLLIPFFIIIILFYKNYIKYFSYVMISTAIIGTIVTYYFYLKYKYFFIAIICIILHLILLYPLININSYLKPNIGNFIFGIISLFIIYFLPYWPYSLSKDSFILLLIFSYFLTYTIYILNKTIKN